MGLEEVRDRVVRGKEDMRGAAESRDLEERRAVLAQEKEAIDEQRAKFHKEVLLKWRVDASKRAIAVRENDRREVKREKKRKEKEDQRLRRFRETQFLDTMRGRSMSPKRVSDEADPEEEEGDMGAFAETKQDGGFLTKAEATQFQKSFEQEERQKRHAEREERRKQEEAKKGKLQDLKGKDPNAMEMLRIKEWRKEEASRKKIMEEARLAREKAQEGELIRIQKADLAREEKWEALEQVRIQREIEREALRKEACIHRNKSVMIGTALPTVLSF